MYPEVLKLNDILSTNNYPGRGIVVGLSENGRYAAFAYFIMGRSENSRNRVFEKTEDGIIIYPFDAAKVSDPSLIIYSPVRKLGQQVIVTNGDQTDTVYNFMKEGKSFEQALKTRCFEPDEPNFTPRISALLNFDDTYSYKMSILKSAGDGKACNRFTYDFEAVNGLGHFIHTYQADGKPIPSFFGEPERVAIGNDFASFADGIWNNLNADNKVSLYVSFTDLENGKEQTKIYNKNI